MEAAMPPTAATDKPAVSVADEGPVQFELFSKEWQNVSQQDNWDGFRIEGAKSVTKFVQAAHTLFLGTQMRPEGYIYQFGPAFQSEDQRTMLVARAGLDGSVHGRAIQKIGMGGELKMSSHSHLTEPRNMYEGAFEYGGSDWSAAAKVAWQNTWLYGGSFSQRLTPWLQMGGDLTLVRMAGLTSIGQIGFRYAEGKNAFTGSLSRAPNPGGSGNLHEGRLQFVRKVSERLSLGTEFKYSYPDKDSGLQVGYEYTFRNARVQGLIDTDGRVSCAVSDFVGFGFSGMIDYAKGDYKFGVVMHVLPQPEGGQPGVE